MTSLVIKEVYSVYTPIIKFFLNAVIFKILILRVLSRYERFVLLQKIGPRSLLKKLKTSLHIEGTKHHEYGIRAHKH